MWWGCKIKCHVNPVKTSFQFTVFASPWMPMHQENMCWYLSFHCVPHCRFYDFLVASWNIGRCDRFFFQFRCFFLPGFETGHRIPWKLQLSLDAAGGSGRSTGWPWKRSWFLYNKTIKPTVLQFVVRKACWSYWNSGSCLAGEVEWQKMKLWFLLLWIRIRQLQTLCDY